MGSLDGSLKLSLSMFLRPLRTVFLVLLKCLYKILVAGSNLTCSLFVHLQFKMGLPRDMGRFCTQPSDGGAATLFINQRALSW
jgi:hypothetical protein